MRLAQVGMTPLHLAADAGHEAAIKLLVAAKADVLAKGIVSGGKGGGGLCCTFALGRFQLEVVKTPNP